MNRSSNQRESAPESEFEGEPAGAAREAYDPGLFLDRLIRRLHLAGDAQLARILHIDKRLLLRIRRRQQPISGSMLMGIQEATGLTIDRLRKMLNDRRRTSRMTARPRPCL